LISFITLIALVGFNLVGTNALATQGITVNDIELKTIELEKENRALQVTVEEVSNLNIMSSVANNHGFIRAHDIVFMPTPPSTAMR